ncbi:hypothetical protein [Streptomyces sp. NPDC002402]
MISVRKALRNAPFIENIPGLHLLALGEAWDAVRVPAEAGFVALTRLRATEDRLGPVLYDRPSQRLYFAVPTGSCGTWGDLPVRLLTSDSWLVAPSPYRVGDWFGGWCELPDDDSLTDPDALRHALRVHSKTVGSMETPPWNPLNVPDSTPTSVVSPPALRHPSAPRRS